MVLTEKSELLNKVYEHLEKYFKPLGGLCVNVYGFTREDRNHLTNIMKSSFSNEGIDIFDYKNGSEKKAKPVTIHLANRYIEIIARIIEKKEGLNITLELSSSDNKTKYESIPLSDIEEKVKEFFPKDKVREEAELIKKYLRNNRPSKSFSLDASL